MTSKEDQFVCEYDDFKELGLPYLQDQDKRQFTMYSLLPYAKDDLQSLVQKIHYTPDFFKHHIPREKVEDGHFLIPKLKFSSGFGASVILKND
ncbi:putative Serpin family protein [Helianthus annuus]|nr:putative Serpin family protein [Helianthus annuus]